MNLTQIWMKADELEHKYHANIAMATNASREGNADGVRDALEIWLDDADALLDELKILADKSIRSGSDTKRIEYARVIYQAIQALTKINLIDFPSLNKE